MKPAILNHLQGTVCLCITLGSLVDPEGLSKLIVGLENTHEDLRYCVTRSGKFELYL
jgi:hypothetical protein